MHRRGSERDELAAEVAAVADGPLSLVLRPGIVERTVALYARWQRELDPTYRPDLSGLNRVIDCGLAGRT